MSMTDSIYGKKYFLNTASDTKILQSIYFAYKVGIISSYSNRIYWFYSFILMQTGLPNCLHQKKPIILERIDSIVLL